jgi:hypothetical protein
MLITGEKLFPNPEQYIKAIIQKREDYFIPIGK